jgi:hypothetical protein
VNHARRDLCGGCPAMGIPTAIEGVEVLEQKNGAPEFDILAFCNEEQRPNQVKETSTLSRDL